MVVASSSTGLYPELLGTAWWDLAEGVRRAHLPGTTRGCFEIKYGNNPLARRLAGWSRLPRPTSCAATVLEIVEAGSQQHWHRTFDGGPFSTCQWRENSSLVESFAGWQLCFELTVEEGALIYVQRRARLCIRDSGLQMPLAMAPRVHARESAEEEGRVRVEVEVSLPMVGRLIAYRGFLDVGQAPL